VDLDRRLDGRDGRHERDHVRRAAHVALHLLHASGRLDADAAGVEGQALADEDELLLGLAAGRVRHVDEARRARAPLPHSGEEVHAALFDGPLIEHGDLEAVRLAHRDSGVSERLWIEDVRRLVDEITRDADGLADALPDGYGVSPGLADLLAGGDRDALEGGLREAFAREVAREAVGTQDNALGGRALAAFDAGRESEDHRRRLCALR
jgi:hypothetical protein